MLEQIDKEIFLHCLPQMPAKPLVFDIGAHTGSYTDFVKEVCPQAKVFLFEPNKTLAKEIKHKDVYAMAVSNVNGTVPIYLCKGGADELSSMYRREVFDDIDYLSVPVESTTLDSFIKALRINAVDFVKIDVEGAELLALQGAEQSLMNKKIKFLQVEYGGTYPDAGIKFTDVIKFVHSVGYKVFEKADVWIEVTIDNFIEDYRYQNFLLTY